MFGLAFVATVLGKTAGRGAFPAFVRSLRRMEIVPRTLVRPVAMAVVGAEGLVAVAMAVPALPGVTAAGLVLAALMLAVFGAAIGRSLRRGDRTPCPCFGRSVAPLGAAHVVPALVVVRFDDLLALFRPPAAAS